MPPLLPHYSLYSHRPYFLNTRDIENTITLYNARRVVKTRHSVDRVCNCASKMDFQRVHARITNYGTKPLFRRGFPAYFRPCEPIRIEFDGFVSIFFPDRDWDSIGICRCFDPSSPFPFPFFLSLFPFFENEFFFSLSLSRSFFLEHWICFAAAVPVYSLL